MSVKRAGWLCCLFGGALAAASNAAADRIATIDTARSSIEFSLRTRWGQVLDGRFPRFDGSVITLPDGRHRVRVRMSARDIEIVGHDTYTRLTRGENFFDAARYPDVIFESDPYSPVMLRHGGTLEGELTAHGVTHRATFSMPTATCDTPGRGCDAYASGSIERSDYGMDRWSLVLGDEVRFSFRVRVRDDDSDD